MDFIAWILALGAILGAFSLGYARGRRAPLIDRTPFPWDQSRRLRLVPGRDDDEHRTAGVG